MRENRERKRPVKEEYSLTFEGSPITCEVYALHVAEALKVPMVEIPPREVEKAFHTAWLNIVCHIEDEASSESDEKVEWYSNCHNNLTDDL